MFEEAYRSANKKIRIRPEAVERTKKKVIEQLNRDSSKPSYYFRYGMVAAALCIVIAMILVTKGYLNNKNNNSAKTPPITQTDEKNQEEKTRVDLSKLNPAVKEVLDKEYIKLVKLEMINNMYPVIYVEFTYNYELDTTGVREYEAIMEKVAKANDYISFQIIDESKKLNFKVDCDKDAKKIKDIYVNGNKNLLKEIKDYENEISGKREQAMEYLKQQVPEIKEFEEKIKKDSNGKATLQMRVLISPDKYSNNKYKDYYQIYVGESNEKLDVKWNIFYVNEALNKVMAEDPSTENMISLDQWRKIKDKDNGQDKTKVDDSKNQFFFKDINGEKHYL